LKKAERQHLVIRRDTDNGPMWLTREKPLAWGQRDRAIRYRSKGEAARLVERLRLDAVSIEPVPSS
jgi:hypothetical protein